ncbi:MAG: hypothetical protein ABIE74_05595 [Pseudomonadota bacterium]
MSDCDLLKLSCFFDWNLFFQGLEVCILFFGFIWAIISFNKSKKCERNLQQDHFKKTLNNELYKEISNVIFKTKSSITKFNVVILTLLPNIKFYWEKKLNMGLNPCPIGTNADSLSKLNNEWTNHLLSLINELERYLIVFPQLKTSKEMISMQFDIISKKWNAFFMEIISFLPTNLGNITDQNRILLLDNEYCEKNGNLISIRKISSEQLTKIKKISNELTDALSEIPAYLEDISVSLQNLLLGDLFSKNRLTYRTPKDKKYMVLKLDDKSIMEQEKIISQYCENRLKN